MGDYGAEVFFLAVFVLKVVGRVMQKARGSGDVEELRLVLFAFFLFNQRVLHHVVHKAPEIGVCRKNGKQ